MRSYRFIIVMLLFFGIFGSAFSQQKVKTKSSVKVPKFSISIMAGFGYVLGSANGDIKSFTSAYNTPGGDIFNAKSLGMQQGYGLIATGKSAVGKKRKLRVTGTLGYNLFYNSEDRGKNRTKWSLFNLGAGVEYCFNPKQKQRVFVGCDLDYTLTFGGWQIDYTYPDKSVSNIYTKFKPLSRFGASVGSGMEFRLNKKMDLILGIKGVWVNIFPKQNSYSESPYVTYMNDSGNNNGIQLDGKKNIIYMQVFTGITLPLSYK
jgi:hypothetical protein